jgi:hypothetical protein
LFWISRLQREIFSSPAQYGNAVKLRKKSKTVFGFFAAGEEVFACPTHFCQRQKCGGLNKSAGKILNLTALAQYGG